MLRGSWGERDKYVMGRNILVPLPSNLRREGGDEYVPGPAGGERQVYSGSCIIKFRLDKLHSVKSLCLG